MHISQLSVVNFKNYKEANIDLSSQINVFVGNNGQGKTNLLDGIYYLSFCKSFLNPVDKQNIKIDEKFFMLNGQYQKEDKKIEWPRFLLELGRSL